MPFVIKRAIFHKLQENVQNINWGFFILRQVTVYYYLLLKSGWIVYLTILPHHCLNFIEYMCSHFLQIYYTLRNLKKVLLKKLYYLFLNLHSSGSFGTEKSLRKTVELDISIFPLFHSCRISFLYVRLRKRAHLWVTFTIKVSLNCCVSRHSFFPFWLETKKLWG